MESAPSIVDNLEAIEKAGPTGAALRILRFQGVTMITYRGPGPYRVGESNIISEVLGTGTDPTVIEHDGRRMRLLRVSGAGNQLVAYIRSPAMVDCTSAEVLAAKLRTMLGADEIALQIRTDAWFTAEDFPLLFPFAPDNEGYVYRSLPSAAFVVPPRVQEYYRAVPELIFQRGSRRETCVIYGAQDKTIDRKADSH
jgi:hypothetical protein